jgi:hypothetical protein
MVGEQGVNCPALDLAEVLLSIGLGVLKILWTSQGNRELNTVDQLLAYPYYAHMASLVEHRNHHTLGCPGKLGLGCIESTEY